MITNYDPNIRWSKHTFELTFMQWDYSLTVAVEIGGNCKGSSLFGSAVSEAFDDLYSAEDGCATITLQRGEDTLEVTLEEPEDLEKLCVGIKIIGHVGEKRK